MAKAVRIRPSHKENETFLSIVAAVAQAVAKTVDVAASDCSTSTGETFSLEETSSADENSAANNMPPTIEAMGNSLTSGETNTIEETALGGETSFIRETALGGETNTVEETALSGARPETIATSSIGKLPDAFESRVREIVDLIDGAGNLTSADIEELKRITIKLCRQDDPNLSLRDHLQVWALSLKDILFKDEREEQIKAFIAEFDKSQEPSLMSRVCAFCHRATRRFFGSLLPNTTNKEKETIEEDRVVTTFMGLADLFLRGQDEDSSTHGEILPAKFDRDSFTTWVLDARRFNLLLRHVSGKVLTRVAHGLRRTPVSDSSLLSLIGETRRQKEEALSYLFKNTAADEIGRSLFSTNEIGKSIFPANEIERSVF